MKIALVIERMNTALGGRETSVAQVADALSRRGHEVSILCQHGSWDSPGVQIVELGSSGMTRSGRLLGFISAVQREIVRSDQFDIVHTTLPIPGANVYQPRGGTIPGQRAAAMRRRSPIISLARKFAEPLNACRSLLARLEREVVADPNTICLAVSQMIADEFNEYYSRRDGVHMVYNGVDIPDFTDQERQEYRQKLRNQIGADANDTLFVTIATNFALKGISQAIRALAMLRKTQGTSFAGRLVMIGKEKTQRYQRLANNCGVGDCVTFTGPTSDVFRWLCAADVCVLLSWYDPCSRVVLEAARWGLPSISTAFNGASEAVAPDGGIVVSSPRDVEAIAAAMEHLSHSEARSAASEACHKVADDLSIDRHIDELIAVYEEILR